MKGEKLIHEVPSDVWRVWAIQAMSIPIGKKLYDWCAEIVEKYPQYFEWEHKYKKIPKEVHEAYLDELYPDRHKPLDFEYKGDKSKGYIPTILEGYAGTVTKQDVIDFFEAPYKRRQEKVEEEKRMEMIWNKHYKKYKLKYRP